MSTINKVRGDVMRKLRQPSERSLADGAYIDEAALEVGDELTTDLNQTRVPWFLLDFVLETQAGQDEYPIDVKAPSFGKVRFAYTIDESDSSFRRRSVDIVDYEDLTAYFDAGDPVSTAAPTNYKHTAEAMSFVYKVGIGNLAIVGPIPGQAARYKIIYEPDVLRASGSQGDIIRLRQFDALVAVMTALKCLPACEWDDFLSITDPVVRDGANRARRKEIAGFLEAERVRLADQFRRVKWTNKNPQDDRAIGFGQSRWRR